MRYLFIVCLSIITLPMMAQESSEQASYNYTAQTWRAVDYVNMLDTLVKYADFKGVRKLKGESLKGIKSAILNLSEAAIKQVNIDGTYFCEAKHEDCMALWNLNYRPLTKSTFDKLCKPLIFFMMVDGVLKEK